MPPPDIRDYKLFPRNLTARADTLVRGNPVTTRPESGVENCFPGLEFDQRNMDKVFFPGLLFEMHHNAGVILRDFDTASSAATFLNHQDIASGGIFLAYVQGTFASRIPGVQPSTRLLRFTPPAGLDSWRYVRDLELDNIAIILCGPNVFAGVANGLLDAEVAEQWLKVRDDRQIQHPVLGRFVLLFGKRAQYLNSDGVIDPETIRPGELTQSLCSPWQYDFADCGCFYWASNKPDLVSSDAQSSQVLNFQRKNRTADSDRTTTADDWLLVADHRWDGDGIVRHADMLSHWQELPFVVRRRETDGYTESSVKDVTQLLDRKAIVQRLRKLATVEHALAIEYLYAYYSMGLPHARPENLDSEQNRIFSAGSEIFQIAIDEMRHLRTVNEVLIELGEPAELGRADIIGEDFDNNNKAFNHQFVLKPLRLAQLNWFIDVEAASQNQADSANTIDGMYTHILRSVQKSTEFSADEKLRLSSLVKVIIDEGIDHYARFTRAKRALAGIDESTYLKIIADAPLKLPSSDPDAILQDVADAAYMVVLRSLDYVFRLGDAQRGGMLESARRAMYNMDDAVRSLAERGKGALFDFRRFGPATGIAQGNAPVGVGQPTTAESVGEPLRNLLGKLGKKNPALAERMDGRLRMMTSEFEGLTHVR